ncbi:DUF6318 family protein [Cellulomonas sp. 179-A 4D5 NHS]|uniref:DUF6318 family protein n=1 Tax=Cellulomonas sp. 179-A 4D5 NHS TaxID=3142378 RepID=UPI0039A29C67
MPSPRAADDARRPARRRDRYRPVRAAAGAVAVLAALLTGCTGEPTAEPSPTRTATASPTASPTPTPTTTPEPERPAAMDDPGVDGAVAAATYFLSLYPYVHATGDLAAWKAMSHPECGFCASVTEGVSAMHALGNKQTGGVFTVRSSQPTEVEAARFFAVVLDVEQAESVETDERGTVTSTVPGGRYTMTILVIREGDAWLIRASEAKSA